MELEWRRGHGKDLDLWANGKFIAWIDGVARPYEVHIVHSLAGDVMPCEGVKYVTLRQAMRTLKETVVILLIGRDYGT